MVHFDIDLTKNKNTDAKYITINWEVNKLGRMTEIRKNILAK